MRCKLLPMTPPTRNHFVKLWRDLWVQAGGLPRDFPAILKDGALAELPAVGYRSHGGACPPPPPPAWTKTAGPTPRAAHIPLPPMPPQRPVRALVATHDLSLSGAPVILANLLPHLRRVEARVYSPCDGPLRSRFLSTGIDVTHDADLEGADLVIANTLLSAPMVEAARQAGVPCVWLIHEHEPHMCGNFDAVKDLIHSPQLVVFPHESTARHYEELRADRVRVVPSIVPPPPLIDRAQARKELRVRKDDHLILTVGRDEPRKGFADLKDALQGKKDRVVRLCDEDYPWTYYAAADLLVSCSRVEAYPLCLQEARAYGLPIIATDIAGNRAVLQEGEALWYTPGDVPALRTHLETMRRGSGRFRTVRGPDQVPAPTFGDSVAGYEAAFLWAAGWGLDSPPTVVWHCAQFARRREEIVLEQLEQFAACGLRRILCTHVGELLDWTLEQARRLGIELVVASHHDRLDVYERPAIELIERLVQTSDQPILYCHTKGMSHDDDNPFWHDWRRLLMAATVLRWRENLAYLVDHDAVGVAWWTTFPVTHFSGNFWLARADWLRRLPKIADYWKDRYSAERWIGSVEGCRAKSLLCKDAAFWDRDRPLFDELVRTYLPARS